MRLNVTYSISSKRSYLDDVKGHVSIQKLVGFEIRLIEINHIVIYINKKVNYDNSRINRELQCERSTIYYMYYVDMVVFVSLLDTYIMYLHSCDITVERKYP